MASICLVLVVTLAAVSNLGPRDVRGTSGVTFKPMHKGLVDHRTKLVADLFSGYNKHVNPDNLILKFGISLVDLRPHINDNALELDLWLRYLWTDSRLQWTKEEYGGVTLIRVPPDNLWRTDLTLYNSADEVNRISCWKSPVLLYETGEALDVPPCRVSIRCNFTLKKYPLAQQTCQLVFGSWSFDGASTALGFYQGQNYMDLKDFTPAFGYEIVSTSAVVDEHYYPCCPDPYSRLVYNVTFRKTQ